MDAVKERIHKNEIYNGHLLQPLLHNNTFISGLASFAKSLVGKRYFRDS